MSRETEISTGVEVAKTIVVGLITLVSTCAVLIWLSSSSDAPSNNTHHSNAPSSNTRHANLPAELPTPVQSKLRTPTVNTMSATDSGGISVAWDRISNASNYELQWATSSAFMTDTTSSVSTDATFGDLHSLNPNTTYYVRVMAIGSGRYSNSDYSTVRSATTTTLKLDTPTVTVVPGNNGIRVTWNLISNASHYEIQYATNSAFTNDVRTVESTTVLRDITGLNANTTYHVRVRAQGTAGESDYSTVRSATTLRLKLRTPTILTPPKWGRSTIDLRWTPIPNATSYTVEYSTNPSFNSGVRSVTSRTASREITGLLANTRYHVRVKAQGTGYTDSDFTDSIWIHTDR